MKKYHDEQCIVAINDYALVLYSDSDFINNDINTEKTRNMDDLGFVDGYPEKPGVYLWTGTITVLEGDNGYIDEVSYVADNYKLLMPFDKIQ